MWPFPLRLLFLTIMAVGIITILVYMHTNQVTTKHQQKSYSETNAKESETSKTKPKVETSDDDVDKRIEKVMSHLQDSSSQTNNGRNGTSNNRARILVFTSKRSGSSFTGAILATNPDIFYMFEPLRLYPLDDIDEEVDTSKVECWDEPLACPLNYLYECNLKKYFDDHRLLKTGEKSDHTRMIWFRRIFGKEEKDLGIQSEHSDLDKICKENYTHIAAKIIRGETIESVVPLLEKGVKILYLLRDPRGIINSRRTFGTANMPEFNMLKQIMRECSKNDENLIFINKAARDPQLYELFSKNFRIMRYEDLAKNLSIYAQKMYDFFEIEMPDIVKKFAKLNPKVNLWGIPDESLLTGAKKPKVIIPDASIPHLEKWQEGLSYFVVQSVQQVCKITLLSLGYNFVMTQDEMKKPFQGAGTIPDDLPFVLT